MIFNIVVDLVVQAVLEEVCSPQKFQHGTAWDGRRGQGILFFYADDGRIAGRYHEWVQDSLPIMVAMFRQMGQETNLDKTKAVVCTPRFIRRKWGIWPIRSGRREKGKTSGSGIRQG